MAYIKRNIEIFSLIFIALSFVFKITIGTPAIVILIIINIFKKERPDYKIIKYFTISFILIFILYCLSVLFTEEGSRIIVRSLAFIFIPVLFHLKKFSNKEITYFTGAFVLFQVIHILYIDAIMIKAIFIDRLPGFVEITGVVEKQFIIYRPYFALNCLLSIICVRYLWKNNVVKVIPVFAILLFVIISLLLIGARLALGVSVILLILFILESNKIKYTLLLFGVLGIAGLFFSKYAIERIMLINGEPREVIWKCAYNIATDDNFNILVGEFSGERVDKKLIDCYNSDEVSKGEYWWISKLNYDYNTHNQFLWFYCSFGLLGLLLFLSIFLRHFLNLIKFKNQMSLYFIIVFFSQALFENILSRQLGIYLFIWFTYFLIMQEQTLSDE